MKVFMWLAVCLLVYWAWKSRLQTYKSRQSQGKREWGHRTYSIWRQEGSARADVDSNKTSETMVKCSYCQLHVPISEACYHASHYFCSQTHVTLYEHMPTKDRTHHDNA